MIKDIEAIPTAIDASGHTPLKLPEILSRIHMLLSDSKKDFA